jgi:hypothetical protein
MKKILFSLISLSIIFSSCSLSPSKKNETMKNIEKKVLPEGTFQKNITEYGFDGYSGTVYVKGYSKTKRVKESFCLNGMNESGTAPCKESEYVLFYILESGKTPSFDAFLPNDEAYNGNHFFDTRAIGLGCIFDGNIVYSNSSDSYEIINGTLGINLSKKILGSTQENSIFLKLTTKLNTSGKGAPTCYSFVSIIESF